MDSKSALKDVQLLSKQAVDLLEEHLAEQKAAPMLLRALGRIRMLQGRPAEAIQLFRRALQVHSERPGADSATPVDEISLPNRAAMLRNPDLESRISDVEFAQAAVVSVIVTEIASQGALQSRIEPDAASHPTFLRHKQVGLDFELSGNELEEEVQCRFEETLEDVLDIADLADEAGEEEEVDDEFESILALSATEESGDIDWDKLALDADDFGEFDDAFTREDWSQMVFSEKECGQVLVFRNETHLFFRLE